MTSTVELNRRARLFLEPYLDWVQREGLPVAEGFAIDFPSIETSPWPRYGVNGAAVHLTGRGDFANCFAIDIPQGRSTEPQRHLYEEVMYVVEGRGSTQIELPDGRAHSFEWQQHSMFAIPLNVRYRLFNSDGHNRALLASVTSLPLNITLFHNEGFIFKNDYFFADRIGKDDWYVGKGDLTVVLPGQNIWETNFVADLTEIELIAWSERGTGSGNLVFHMGDSNMHTHMSEIAPGTYKKAHHHHAGVHIFTVTGKGYSLLWMEDDQDYVRVDWKPGTLWAPVARQFHQHFTTSTVPSRYLAISAGANTRYPLTDQWRSYAVSKEGVEQGTISTSTKRGGNQIEYEDQDPRIHALWLDEMRKNGITPQIKAAPSNGGRNS